MKKILIKYHQFKTNDIPPKLEGCEGRDVNYVRQGGYGVTVGLYNSSARHMKAGSPRTARAANMAALRSIRRHFGPFRRDQILHYSRELMWIWADRIGEIHSLSLVESLRVAGQL